MWQNYFSNLYFCLTQIPTFPQHFRNVLVKNWTVTKWEGIKCSVPVKLVNHLKIDFSFDISIVPHLFVRSRLNISIIRGFRHTKLSPHWKPGKIQAYELDEKDLCIVWELNNLHLLCCQGIFVSQIQIALNRIIQWLTTHFIIWCHH